MAQVVWTSLLVLLAAHVVDGAPTAQPSQGRCAGWCATSPKPWEDKCRFNTCSACRQCIREPPPPNHCQDICQTADASWTDKCKRDECEECDECETDDDPPAAAQLSFMGCRTNAEGNPFRPISLMEMADLWKKFCSNYPESYVYERVCRTREIQTELYILDVDLAVDVACIGDPNDDLCSKHPRQLSYRLSERPDDLPGPCNPEPSPNPDDPSPNLRPKQSVSLLPQTRSHHEDFCYDACIN